MTTSVPLVFFDHRWPVIFLDNHLLAVYKPSGLLVQGDRTGDISLQELGKRWLKAHYGKPGAVFLAMVHRLDRPVAGIVLFARTSKAAARLSHQFRERAVEKRYLAVVHGCPPSGTHRLVDQVERRERMSRVVPTATPTSRQASLCFTVLERREDRALLQVVLETGRHHQIRLQLAHRGYPIVGDRRYGSPAALADRQIALLAHELRVDHPTRPERLALSSPLPRSWPWPPANGQTVEGPPWAWGAFASSLRSLQERQP